MSEKVLNSLSPDKPLRDPNDDRLGYATFAKTLAESIVKMTPAEGLVISVYGAWGTGKSTLSNFLVRYLSQYPQNERPIVVKFNPWWFTGQEDLTRRFFDQLNAILGERKAVGEDVIGLISTFADLVSQTPIPFASSGKIIAQASHLLRPKQEDVPQLKERIADALRKQAKKILVLIDDIDRLTADEIKHLFRVVKAVGDFPNVVYLLSFDKKVAVKALEGLQGVSGEEYLEKIIQVPFELPFPDKASLRRLLFEKLSAVLADTPQENFDQTYWGNVYLEGIDQFISTPRDVTRLINTLSVIYPSVKGEVNVVDLIALESLRIFCPLVYDAIRKNPDAFTGHSRRDENIKSFYEALINQLQEHDRDSIRKMLMRIFPKLEGVFGNRSYGSDWESDWRKRRRLCSPEKFPIYFLLAIPQGDFSDAEMKSIIQLGSNAKSFGEKLIELSKQKRPDGRTRLRAFLEKLEDYTHSEIPLKFIPSIVQALFEVGDSLLQPEDEHKGLFDFGNDIRIGRVLWQLLRRFDQPARFEILKQAMADGKSVTMIGSEVVVLGQQHGKYGSDHIASDDEMIVSAEHRQQLEQIALDKIRQAAGQGNLIESPKLPNVLYRWRGWGSEEEPKFWVQKIIADNEKLITLLSAFLKKTFGHTFGDAVSRMSYRLDPKSLEPFLEPASIIDRVRNIAPSDGLKEEQRIALNQFIKEYEIRQSGGDPDDRFA